MMETSWVRSLSLVVANFTLSHVMAIVLKADTADDVNLSSNVVGACFQWWFFAVYPSQDWMHSGVEWEEAGWVFDGCYVIREL